MEGRPPEHRSQGHRRPRCTHSKWIRPGRNRRSGLLGTTRHLARFPDHTRPQVHRNERVRTQQRQRHTEAHFYPPPRRTKHAPGVQRKTPARASNRLNSEAQLGHRTRGCTAVSISANALPRSGQRWVLATSSQPCQLVAAVSAPHCRRRGEPKSLDVNHIRHSLCELYCRPTCACASRLRPTPAVRRPL